MSLTAVDCSDTDPSRGRSMTAEDWEGASLEDAMSFARRVVAGSSTVEFVEVRSHAPGRIAVYRHAQSGLEFVLVVPQVRPAGSADVRPFLICRTEVPQSAWRRSRENPSGFVGDELPVDGVTWTEAREWCEGLGFQLPTAAEWDSAVPDLHLLAADPQAFGNLADQSVLRGPVGPVKDVGDWRELLGLAKYDDGYPGTAPCGRFRPSRWGLVDALGNVWEWCADAAGAEDHVVRGGGWSTPPSTKLRAFSGELPTSRRQPGGAGFRPIIRLQFLPE